jgi:hypothetical protein
MKIPTNNDAVKRTHTSPNVTYKNKIKFLYKKTTFKYTTIPCSHTECKHMATHMGQHRKIHK